MVVNVPRDRVQLSAVDHFPPILIDQRLQGGIVCECLFYILDWQYGDKLTLRVGHKEVSYLRVVLDGHMFDL